jgi:phytol kinase
MVQEINIIHEIIIALGFTMAFGLMFFLSEMMYLKLRLDAEITRKFIHVSCGSIALMIPIIRPHLYTIIILGMLFSLLTFYMLRRGLLPSVNNVKRHTIGSILYPLGIVLCTLFGMMDNYRIYFFIPICTLIFSDTIAAMVGFNYPIRKFKIMGFTKSIGGSIGFFVSAFAICFILSSLFIKSPDWQLLLTDSVSIAMATAFIEMISVDGWDDVTIPVTSFLMLWGIGG